MNRYWKQIVCHGIRTRKRLGNNNKIIQLIRNERSVRSQPKSRQLQDISNISKLLKESPYLSGLSSRGSTVRCNFDFLLLRKISSYSLAFIKASNNEIFRQRCGKKCADNGQRKCVTVRSNFFVAKSSTSLHAKVIFPVQLTTSRMATTTVGFLICQTK